MSDNQAQNEDKRRLLNYIAREQLVSCMNDTKWNKLISAMDDLGDKCPPWRCKTLREETISNWDYDWKYHIPTFLPIEWIDIDPIVTKHRGQLIAPEKVADHTEMILALLKANSIPCSKEGKYFRIWGYQRPGQSIDFV